MGRKFQPNWFLKTTILDKINGKPRPRLPHKSRMRKWRVFALRAASCLIWREGGGYGGLLFHFFCPRLQVITCGFLLYANFVVIVVVSQECSGSICLRFQLLECQCKQEENLCDLCCKNGEDGECKPIRDMGVSNITNALQQFPGAPCDNFNGYCDVFLKCRAVDADGPLSRLKNKFFSKEAILGYLEWIKEHWWAVLLMGIGLILLMAGKIYHSVVVVLEIGSFRF